MEAAAGHVRHRNSPQIVRCKLLEVAEFALSAGREGVWDLPTAHYKIGETIRQTAERALGRAITGLAPHVFFIGHAPCAHYTVSGGDCFIHKAQIIDGSIYLAENSDYEDFAWLCREEVLERIEPITHELFAQLLPSSIP